MKEDKLGQLIIGIILVFLVLPFCFNYYMTKCRLEKIYKIENPPIIHILWEMRSNNGKTRK